MFWSHCQPFNKVKKKKTFHLCYIKHPSLQFLVVLVFLDAPTAICDKLSRGSLCSCQSGQFSGCTQHCETYVITYLQQNMRCSAPFCFHFPLQCFIFTVFCPSSLPQSCDAAMRVRYFPVISLGSGVVPGHGTWPSTSQMHSLRQYFFGPKLAGLDACFLASASPFNTSLKEETKRD